MSKKKKHNSKNRLSSPKKNNDQNSKEVRFLAESAYKSAKYYLNELKRTNGEETVNGDLDHPRVKRRTDALVQSMPQIKKQIKDTYPAVLEESDMLFSDLEEELAFLNFLPAPAYDEIDAQAKISLGAAIWMLDHIKKHGNIAVAVKKLPSAADCENDPELPSMYDPVHQNDVIQAMLHVIRNRNRDCDNFGKTDNSDGRVFADLVTTCRKQHQDVPSRQLFEELLGMIREKDIQEAVEQYTAKLKEWIIIYFRCRSVFIKQQDEMEAKHQRKKEQFNNHWAAFCTTELGVELPNISNFGCKKMNHLLSDPIQFCEIAQTEEIEMQKEAIELAKKRTEFMLYSPGFSGMTAEDIERSYGSEIAEIVSDFEPGDPYTMCFALLYLLDTDSTIPWLYYANISVIGYAQEMLPWNGPEYRAIQDSCWIQYYSPFLYGLLSENKETDTESNSCSHLNDWFRLDYGQNHKNSKKSKIARCNLAQIVYEATGCIMPRDIHRYDDMLERLQYYSVPDEKAQVALFSMLLLGENKAQTRIALPDLKSDDGELPKTENVFEQLPPTAAPDPSDTDEQISDLKAENENLKRLAYEASRDARVLREQQEELLEKAKEAQQELAELREILFSLENGMEPEQESDAKDIQIPYEVKHNIVVFGGHDSWAKAIKPMLTGNIRFVDKDMNPDANLIRYADVIWIQSNSLSHAFFYKIINAIRTNKVPVHYFKYASAEKCAKQLAATDQKSK